MAGLAAGDQRCDSSAPRLSHRTAAPVVSFSGDIRGSSPAAATTAATAASAASPPVSKPSGASPRSKLRRETEDGLRGTSPGTPRRLVQARAAGSAAATRRRAGVMTVLPRACHCNVTALLFRRSRRKGEWGSAELLALHDAAPGRPAHRDPRHRAFQSTAPRAACPSSTAAANDEGTLRIGSHSRLAFRSLNL